MSKATFHYFISSKDKQDSLLNRVIMTSHSSSRTVKFHSNVLMQWAITDGDVEEMKQLINAYGRKVVNEPEPTGLFPVMRCVFEGQLECLCLLLEYEADLTVQDSEKWTALHVAASMDDVDAAKVILDNCRTCLTQVCNGDGERPIDLAESTEMASYLVDMDMKAKKANAAQEMMADETAILNIIHKHVSLESNYETLNTVLQNSTNYDSLLHLAATKNYPRLASYLLSNRLCQLGLRDRWGRTVLETAIYHKSMDMMLILLGWM